MSEQQVALLEKILLAATKDPMAPIKATIDSLLDPQPEENLAAPSTAPSTALAPTRTSTMYERIERIERLLTEQAAKVVIPDGYPEPAEGESDAALQYVEALRALEAAHRVNMSIASDWHEIIVRPSTSFQFSMVAMATLKGIAEEARGQLSINVAKVSIPRELAELACRLAKPGSAEEVAHGEFVAWSLDRLRSCAPSEEEARIVLANLVATGLVE